MKVKVGYVTSWRKAVFFSLIGFILFFGFSRTISQSFIGANRITSIISLMAFLIGGIWFVYVCFGSRYKFEGEGILEIKDGQADYRDKKRHFCLPLHAIKKIDILPITFQKQGGKPLAYQVIVASDKKTYYIESEFVTDQSYDQVDLYKLYLYLQETKNEK